MKISKFIIFTLSLLTFGGCFSTKHVPYSDSGKKYKAKYADEIESDETILTAWYHYVTTVNKKGEYIVRKYFPEKNLLTDYITYKSPNFKIMDGTSKLWYDNGKLMSEGNYLKNKKDGEWKNYGFPSGKISSQGQYQNGNREGNWKFYDSKGRMRREVNYLKNIREGEFVIYDTLSNIVNEGIYKADTIFQQSNKIEGNIKVVEEMPVMKTCKDIVNPDEKKKCSEKLMLTSIYKNIKYPSKAREFGMEGTALVRFVVEKDGSLSQIYVIRGVCESIARECRRIIQFIPEWEPGYQNGKAVKVQYTLPVKFNLL